MDVLASARSFRVDENAETYCEAGVTASPSAGRRELVERMIRDCAGWVSLQRGPELKMKRRSRL